MFKCITNKCHPPHMCVTSQLKGIILSSLWDNTAALHRNVIKVAAGAMTLLLLVSQALILIWQPGFRIFHIFCYLYTNQEYLFMKQTCIMTFIILSIRLETFGDENIPFGSILMRTIYVSDPIVFEIVNLRRNWKSGPWFSPIHF